MEKKKILIVDDEKALVQLLKLNLEETGQYQVETETQGSKALAKARAFQPDLILLDIIMPDRNGYEVAREIQADPSLQQVPIVFLTAADSKGVKTEVQEKGVSGFPVIEKPIGVEELTAHIKQNVK